MKTLNVIGAGRVGRTLAALWRQKQVFTVQDVLDGMPEGGRSAVAYIAEGRAVERITAMRAADVWMIATPDGMIGASAQALAAAGRVRSGDIVFPCSGSLASTEISGAVPGARAASIHPLK